MLKTRKPLKMVYISTTIILVILVLNILLKKISIGCNLVDSTEYYRLEMLNLIYLLVCLEIGLANIVMTIIDIIKSIKEFITIKFPIIMLIINIILFIFSILEIMFILF